MGVLPDKKPDFQASGHSISFFYALNRIIWCRISRLGDNNEIEFIFYLVIVFQNGLIAQK